MRRERQGSDRRPPRGWSRRWSVALTRTGVDGKRYRGRTVGFGQPYGSSIRCALLAWSGRIDYPSWRPTAPYRPRSLEYARTKIQGDRYPARANRAPRPDWGASTSYAQRILMPINRAGASKDRLIPVDAGDHIEPWRLCPSRSRRDVGLASVRGGRSLTRNLRNGSKPVQRIGVGPQGWRSRRPRRRAEAIPE